MKKTKLIFFDKEYFYHTEKDENFLGNEKLIFDLDDNTQAIISINLVKIIGDETVRFTRS